MPPPENRNTRGWVRIRAKDVKPPKSDYTGNLEIYPSLGSLDPRPGEDALMYFEDLEDWLK